MKELFQCIFCASIGFMTASLLAAGKNHSTTEAGIENSPKSDIVSEVSSASNLSGRTKNT